MRYPIRTRFEFCSNVAKPEKCRAGAPTPACRGPRTLTIRKINSLCNSTMATSASPDDHFGSPSTNPALARWFMSVGFAAKADLGLDATPRLNTN
jgi:hypothetical protein